MQIRQVLKLSEQLQQVSESPELDVELMVCHLIGKPSSYLFTWPEREIEPKQVAQLETMVSRRMAGEPVAHILGYRGFWSFELEVSPHTLIPRPDTELLVEQALACCDKKEARVADLGTGTGAIALALATERRSWEVVASDYVDEAVALATRNCSKLQLSNVSIVQGSWFEPHHGRYDMIVSNPPYIDPEDPHLTQGDVRFEPLSALTSDKQGMADIELIAEQAQGYLKPDGYLLFEHGYDQGASSRKLLEQLGYIDVKTYQDYGQNERVTCGRWPGEGTA